MAGLSRLGDALGGALKGLHLEQRKRESRAMALWPDIVGPVVSTKTRPLYVARGTLVVAVSSSAWANQLNLLKPRLLATLAERCGAGVITDLRWRTGVTDAAPGATEPPGYARRTRRERPNPDPPLAPADQARLERLASAIPDAELADTVARALQALARRAERHRAEGWVACKRCGVLHPPGGPLCPPCHRELAAFLPTETP